MPRAHDDDDACLHRIRVICSHFPETEEARLQDRPLFRVRRRRFAIFNAGASPQRTRWEGFGRSLHFATAPRLLQRLQHDPRFQPSPHHGVRGWLALDLGPERINWLEIDALLEAAYRHVASAETLEEYDRPAEP